MRTEVIGQDGDIGGIAATVLTLCSPDLCMYSQQDSWHLNARFQVTTHATRRTVTSSRKTLTEVNKLVHPRSTTVCHVLRALLF